jgi:hypothetical protein
MAEEDAVDVQVVVARMLGDKPAVADMSVLPQLHQRRLKQQPLQQATVEVLMVEALDVEHTEGVNRVDSLGY